MAQFQLQFLTSKKCTRFWTEERGLSLRTAAKLQVGYFEESSFSEYSDRLLFPVWDIDGDLVTFQGRAMFDHARAGRPKFWHSSEGGTFAKNKVLYALYQSAKAIVDKGFAVLTEGPFDVATLMEVEAPATAPLGANLSDDHAMLLRCFTKRIVLWFDQDEAGARGAGNARNILTKWGFSVHEVRTHRAKDANQLLLEQGRDAVWAAVESALTRR